MAKRIVRLKELVVRSGLGRSSIYEMVSSGDFPAPVQIGQRAIGWIEGEFESWLDEKTANRDALLRARSLTASQRQANKATATQPGGATSAPHAGSFLPIEQRTAIKRKR